MIDIIIKNIMIKQLTKTKLVIIFLLVCMFIAGIFMIIQDKPVLTIKNIFDTLFETYFILLLGYCNYQFSQIKNRTTDFLMK
jgi:hypothetical protein